MSVMGPLNHPGASDMSISADIVTTVMRTLATTNSKVIENRHNVCASLTLLHHCY